MFRLSMLNSKLLKDIDILYDSSLYFPWSLKIFFKNKIIAYNLYVRNIPPNMFGLFHTPHNSCQIGKQVLQS